MTDVDLLAMSRYFVFAGVILTIARMTIEASRAIAHGQPVGRVMIRRAAYLPLLGVAIYYVRALYLPGFDEPTSDGVTLLNLFYGAFFMLIAWPSRSRTGDHPPVDRAWR